MVSSSGGGLEDTNMANSSPRGAQEECELELLNGGGGGGGGAELAVDAEEASQEASEDDSSSEDDDSSDMMVGGAPFAGGAFAGGFSAFALHDICAHKFTSSSSLNDNDSDDAQASLVLSQLLRPQSTATNAAEGEAVEHIPIMPPSYNNLNSRDPDDLAPLHVALLHGRQKCARVLLEAGADPSMTCEGAPPLLVAVTTTQFPITKGRHQAFFDDVLDAIVLAVEKQNDGDDDDNPEDPEDIVQSALARSPLMHTDDFGRTAYRLAAEFCANSVGEALANKARAIGTALVARLGEEAAAGARVDADCVLRVMACAADHRGITPMMAAAAGGHAAFVSSVLGLVGTADGKSIVKSKVVDASEKSVLHHAVISGDARTVNVLMQSWSTPQRTTMLGLRDAMGRTAYDLAHANGHTEVCNIFVEHVRASGCSSDLASPTATWASTASAGNAHALGESVPISEPASSLKDGADKTALLYAPLGLEGHVTCAPRTLASRQGLAEDPPPPENARRVEVLLSDSLGILKTDAFAGPSSVVQENGNVEGDAAASGVASSTRFVWREVRALAEVSDVLRVHEGRYVRMIQKACARLQPHLPAAPLPPGVVKDDGDENGGGMDGGAAGAIPSVQIGHLDGDTAISHSSASAAMQCCRTVIEAAEMVMNPSTNVRNAFCVVRPPGHHAGPTGPVCPGGLDSDADINTTGNGGGSSHGFCLINNVAVGASYAMHVGSRKYGVKRVAVIDFDVHHGNGTEALFGTVVPSTRTYRYSTPYGEGTTTTHVWKPWLNENDADNLFFASVHGYGQRGRGGWYYPGSGHTSDARGASRDDEQPNAAAVSGIPELVPNGTAEGVPPNGPHAVNVGIPGPGRKPKLWRRYWRDAILPALYAFKPDVLFVSAGFDAHRRDELNCGYVGVTEPDYAWLTRELVKVANSCCQGRLVSVLEGGYRTQGYGVSAFARSVATHVAELACPTRATYDVAEAVVERRQEEEAQRRRRAEHYSQQLQMHIYGGKTIEGDTAAIASAAAAAAAAPVEEPPAKRRRGAVDYAELNRQLEAEKAGANQ
ncbi:histone deacetylase [Pycnococcus provasolii]